MHKIKIKIKHELDRRIRVERIISAGNIDKGYRLCLRKNSYKGQLHLFMIAKTYLCKCLYPGRQVGWLAIGVAICAIMENSLADQDSEDKGSGTANESKG